MNPMHTERLLAYLAYFEHLVQQPPNRWEGFSLHCREERSFALRFQLALVCCALGAICLHPDLTPANQERCRAAMVALIERMMQRRVWAFWALEAERRGLDPDPLRYANASYRGLLAMMIGLFEVVGGDERFDEPFVMFWNSGAKFPYTHRSLVELLAQQMRESTHHGIERWPGWVYLADMGPILWATTFHDLVHGSDYATANQLWLNFLQRRVVRRGLQIWGRTIFHAMIRSFSSPGISMVIPFGMRFTDVWTLVFLSVVEPELTQKYVPALWRRIRQLRLPRGPARNHRGGRMDGSLMFLPTPSLWRSQELADQHLATALAYVLAVQQAEPARASALLACLDTHGQPLETEGYRYYRAGIAPIGTTAMVAFGEAGGLLALRERIAALAHAHTTHPHSTASMVDTSRQPREQTVERRVYG